VKILVTGGTGTVGSRVVARLAQRGVPTRVLTRSDQKARDLPRGIEGVVGNMEERSPLRDLFAGCDRMFLLTPVSPTEVGQGRNAAIVAAELEMRHVVFLSVHDVEKGEHIPHFKSKLEIERVLNENGVPTTVVMPNNFFQNDLWLRDAIAGQGVYPQPLGSAHCLSRIDAGDIADAVVRLLATDQEPGRRVPLVGPDCLSGPACAAAWGRHLGRPVRYMGDDLGVWATRVGESMPEWLVKDLTTMYAFFQQNGLAASEADLRATQGVLGRAPRSFDDWVRETAADWS